jgi:arginyl-tRNA synthetase
MQELQEAIKKICQELFGVDIEPELTRPEPQFGDYSTNAAMHLAGKLNKNPREIAEAIRENFHHKSVSKVEIAGPGFINFTLTDNALAQSTLSVSKLPKPLANQEFLVEFGDPNPFKEMHIGHLYSYIIGDSVCKLLEKSGATVRRLSYHGDVGLHVAKAIYGMQKEGINLRSIVDPIKVSIGMYYAKGSKAFEEDKDSREEIYKINEHIYKRDNSAINTLYDWGKERSLGYFEQILKDLEVKNDKQYFESEAAPIGIRTIREHMGSVFEESDGAVVYEGEQVGLHTRVFLTKQGLPTYEAKDLGLAELKNKDYPQADRSIVITANEQTEYFKVMLAALNEIDTGLAKKTTHLAHGFLSLSSGKMSSRTGDVYSGVSAIVDIEAEIKKLYPNASPETRNAAIKYDLLKHRLGSDIVYNVEESFSLEGNSGPYLQYTHARACSIIRKSSAQPAKQIPDLEEPERILARKISEYPEVIDKATTELMPHHICTYLYELAQVFNGFYEKCRVVSDPREAIRLSLVSAYAQVLKSGLELLSIDAPEQI